ncbi:MAG TPA: aldo/keto reductase [Shinella sp.]|nr:aldo/keto reductase [Shinella sp.]
MKTRTIGRTDLAVTEFSFGTAALGGLYRACPRDAAMETLEAAWDEGLRYFDTAPWYGFGLAERRVGDFLRDRPKGSWVLSSKVGRVMVPVADDKVPSYGYVDPLPFDVRYDYSYDGIMRSLELSYTRLGLNRIDILYVHDIGRMTHGDRHEHYWSQLTEGGGFRALGKLRDEGSTKAVGLGVNEVPVCLDVMRQADIDCILLAGRYTLLEQESLPLMDECARRGVGIVVAGPFNSGILAGNRKFNYADAPADVLARVDALRAACEEQGISLQAAALQFPLAHPAVVTIVSGARTAEQITSNIAWFSETIPASFWRTLRERGLIAEGAPLPPEAA